MVAENTASLNTGSYLNRTEYSLFVKGFTTDLWYGLSSNDVIELSVWDRDNNFIGWNTLNQSKSYTTTTLTYLNALNFPVTFSYVELNQDFILYKNSGILVNPPSQLSSSFGIQTGSYYLDYNFTREMAGTPTNQLVIKEISPSRRELKLIPIGNSTPAYDAFCKKKVILSDVSPLYLDAVKNCFYDQIYSKVSPYYQQEINTLKSVFFLQTDGAVVNFFRNLYEDLYIYTTVPRSQGSSEVITSSLSRIQGIKTYFTNYLLSNSETIVDFSDIDNRFNTSVSASIEKKFLPIGKNPAKPYVDAKSFVYDFFTKYFYQPLSNTLTKTYKEKYFSYFRNGLNFGNNRLLPILQHGMMDERINSIDSLTLLVKLKEELPSDITEQTSCWVSNISLSPYILNAIVKNSDGTKSHKIGPPNFSLKLPDVSFTNANVSYTADDLANTDEDDREITVSKKVSELSVDYTNFQNFIVFSSAELRLRIFKNKIINLSSYSSSLSTLNARNNSFLLASGSIYPYYTQEHDSLQSQMTEIVDSFDGYESYLYRSGTFTYSNGTFISSSHIAELDNSASYYDKNNRDSLINNCPSHILTNSDNDDYIIFLSMVGHFFDEIYEYISSMPSEKRVGNSATEEFTRRVVDYMLQTFGWNLDDSLEQATLLNNYLTSEQSFDLNSLSSEERLKIIRNRVLTNLPQIYKAKGTEESIKLILACYGIPSTLLSIREYGGVNYVDDTAAYTTYERAYMYQFHTSSIYDIFYNNLTPNAKTYLFKLCLDDPSIYDYNQNVAFMGAVAGATPATISNPSGSGAWAIGFVRREKPNTGEIWFRMGYFDRPAFTLYSGEFPLFDGNVYSVMLRRNSPSDEFDEYGDVTALPCSYDLYVQRNEFGRQIVKVTSSYVSYDPETNIRFSQGVSGSYLVRGNWFRNYNNNCGLHGAFDKLQVWYDPITNGNFEDYVNSINSYAYSGSRPTHESLLFRQHTDYPFNVRFIPPGEPIPILGTLIDWGGVWRNANPFYATGSNIKQNKVLDIFDGANMDTQVILGPWSGSQKLVQNETGCWVSESCYPYQFKIIDYPSTLPTSRYGPNKFRNEKIRHMSQSVETRLDTLARSTYINPNSLSSDSNQLGFFADPQDFKNKDIVRYYGNLNLMDVIGDPSNQYSSSYDSLKILRKQYAASLNEASGSTTLFNELITVYKLYFNRSVFEAIRNLVPARTNTLTGILVEPTILERPKYQAKPIFSEMNSGSVFYADVTASHYFRDPNTKLLRLSMSVDSALSTSLNLSYITLPLRDYPVNYAGNYISDVMDKYSLGHFADGVVYTTQDEGLSFLPYADFTGTPRVVFAGSSVQFTNLSQYGNSYVWDFGDSTAQSNKLNPAHVYNVLGKHTVTLTAYSKWNYYNTNTKTEYIEVVAQPEQPVVADFTGTPLNGNVPMLVTFTNNSTNADSYLWNFGDGSTSTLENPTHTYNAVGVYTVSLVAKLGLVSNSKVETNYITVGNAVIPPDPPAPPVDDVIEVIGGGGSGGCLLPGTQIRMANGTTKNIEYVVVGDILYGTNGSSVIVKQLLPNRFNKYNILNGRLRITYEHPVLVVRNGTRQLVQVKDLLIGDKMVRYNNTVEELRSNVEIFEETPTHNFVVNGDHMYVAEDILVHNTSANERIYKKN